MSTIPRPDGLDPFVGPQVRCAAFGCDQPAHGNFIVITVAGGAPDFEGLCLVHGREVRASSVG